MLAQIFAFLDLDTPDLLIILVIVLLLFGGRKLPELSQVLVNHGELRKGISGGLDEDKPQKKDDKDTSA